MEITFTLQEIDAVAAKVWEEGKHYKTWAFHAGMGSGKTTFIHALCTLLQVGSTVSSPTYAIINEYESGVVGIISHQDWFRLKDEQEAINAGVEDAMANSNLCLIEWPEKAEGLLGDDFFKVSITVVDEHTRIIDTAIIKG
jgi:tRNA threonylcarbamoyladenosine biosynthesis protein TsaE